MISKSMLALLAAAAVVSLTSAAVAQSAGYGSMLPYYYDSSGSPVWGSWGPQQQGSATSRQSQASANTRLGRAGTSGTRRVERPRGHSAFA